MNAQELLAKGIAENNMEIIKEAQLLLLNPKPKGRPKAKTKAKPKTKPTSAKGKNRAKKTKPEENFLEKMYNIEDQRLRAMLEGSAGGIMNPKPIALDDNTYFVDEHEADLNPAKGLGKKKRKPAPRRPKLHFVSKTCPRCQKQVKVMSNIVGDYNFDINNQDSVLTLYNCGCV